MPRILVGKVARPHGLAGHLKLSTFDHDAPSIQVGVTLFLGPLDRPAKEHRVLDVRHTPDAILVILDGVSSRTAAEAVTGLDVSVDEKDLPELEEGEHWAFKMVGMDVKDEAGTQLGTVSAVDDGVAHALISVTTPTGTYDIPWVDNFVLSVDDAKRLVIIRPIPGLLDGGEG